MRLIATTLFLMVLVAGQIHAQRVCQKCGKAKHASRQHSRQLTTERQRRVSDQRVRRVQHTSALRRSQLPPNPPRFQVAQNPLDELQRELEADDAGDDDFLSDLDDISDALQKTDDETPDLSDDNSAESTIDDILRGGTADDDEDDSDRNPLSALEDDEESAEDEDGEDQARNPGLRDDSYYRQLGAPRQVASRSRQSQPLTMGNVFGDDEEYDCQCQQRYCESVWQCAGGRNQSFLDRIRRNRDRDNIVRNASGNGCRPYRNDFKCPKVNNNPNQQGHGGQMNGGYTDGQYFDGQYQDQYMDGGMQDGEYYDGQNYDGQYYGGEVYDAGIIGGEYDPQPSPAEIPAPMVDGS